MKDEPQRRLAIELLAVALKEDAKLVTVEYDDDGLGLRLDWPGSRGLAVRTKVIKTLDADELWFVEAPGHLIAETSDVRGAVKIVRDLSGERVH